MFIEFKVKSMVHRSSDFQGRMLLNVKYINDVEDHGDEAWIFTDEELITPVESYNEIVQKIRKAEQQL